MQWKHINERYNVVHPRTIPEEDSSSTEDGEKHTQRMKTLRERSRVPYNDPRVQTTVFI